MLAVFCYSLFAFFIATTFFDSSAFCDSIVRDLIILTDMEPDDRIALTIIANRPELSKRLLFVGTTLLNTELKAALARRQLRQTGLKHVPVYAGTSGPPSSYPNNVETAKAALSFWHEEGNGILSDEELKKFREINPVEENDSNPVDVTIARMNPVEDIWSIVIEGLPESNASEQADRYQEDYDAVIKLLDIMNMDIPPKLVYRLPKPSGILTTEPRRLQVFFPVSIATPILLIEWNQNLGIIQQKSGFMQLQIHSGMDKGKFIKAKRHFFSGVNNNLQTNFAYDVEDFKFYDALEEFSDEKEDGKKEKKKSKKKKKDRFYDARENFEQSVDTGQKEEEDKAKIGRDEASSHLVDIDWEMVREFLIYDEKERCVIIKGLPEYTTATTNDKHEEQIQPILPSRRYKADFEAVMDALFAIGVEVQPLAIHRMGGELMEGGGRRLIQVIFRSRKVVRIILQSWKRLWSYTQNKKPEWKWLNFNEYELSNMPNLSGNKIGNKKQLSDLLGYLQGTETPEQAISQSTDEKCKGIASSTIANASNNELQSALVEALSKAKAKSIEILLMTAPIDLVQVLDAKPGLAKAIRRVHLMGGWVELKPPYGPPSKRSEDCIGDTIPKQNSLPPPPPTIWGNYNLNMAPESSRRLFAMASEKGLFSMRLYTYRHVWEMFEGSVNRNNFERTISTIQESQWNVLRDFLKAAKSWDEHAMKVMPYLSRFIGKYAGEQFSPADPILVVGLLNPTEFIKERRMIKVHVKHDQLEVLNDVLEVQIEYDVPNSNIELITGLVKGVFREELERSFVHCFNCGSMGHFASDCTNTGHLRTNKLFVNL